MGMINLLNGDAQPETQAENAQAPAQPAPAQPPVDNANEQAGGGNSGEEAQKFAGRFNSVEELERGYEQLNSQQGRTGNEMGTLQTQLTEQNRQMAELIANQNQQAQEPARDLESERMAIGTQMDDGDISIPEGLAQLRKIDAVENESLMQGQMQQMQEGFQTELANRDQDASALRFHQANPEFAQLQQSGALEQIKSENEFINDDYQAFLTHKATLAYTQGKDEAATEIAGSTPAADVASTAGSQMRTETPAVNNGRPMTDSENLDSGLAALDAIGFNK